MQNKIRTKLLIILFFLNIFFITKAFSETINKFNIQGNNRVSNETVIMFSSLKIGDNINQNTLNNSLKKLYYTNYFKDVKIYRCNECDFCFVSPMPNNKDLDYFYEDGESLTSPTYTYSFTQDSGYDFDGDGVNDPGYIVASGGTTGYGYKYDFKMAVSDDKTIILPAQSSTPSVFELKNPNQNIQGRVR